MDETLPSSRLASLGTSQALPGMGAYLPHHTPCWWLMLSAAGALVVLGVRGWALVAQSGCEAKLSCALFSNSLSQEFPTSLLMFSKNTMARKLSSACSRFKVLFCNTRDSHIFPSLLGSHPSLQLPLKFKQVQSGSSLFPPKISFRHFM